PKVSVHHAVERHSTCHAKLIKSRLAMQRRGQTQDGLLQDKLQRMRNVEMMRFKGVTFPPHRPECFLKVKMVDVICAVVSDLDDAAENIREFRLPIRSQRHNLVLIGRVKKSQV